jgi:hypothetical protein
MYVQAQFLLLTVKPSSEGADRTGFDMLQAALRPAEILGESRFIVIKSVLYKQKQDR